MSEMQDSIIILEDASRRFGHRYALKGVDLQVRSGEMLSLIGPNGSGKTTLLKLMAGSIRATSGAVRIFGFDPFVHRTAERIPPPRANGPPQQAFIIYDESPSPSADDYFTPLPAGLSD